MQNIIDFDCQQIAQKHWDIIFCQYSTPLFTTIQDNLWGLLQQNYNLSHLLTSN